MKENDKTIYAIPSYQRADSQYTADYLLKAGVPEERIFVFVQTEDDLKAYMERHRGKCYIVFREADGVAKARNNILNYFAGERNILMLDDDISAFYFGDKDRDLEEIPAERFETVIEQTFQLCSALKGKLLGYYPVCNNFFMSNSVCLKKPVNTVIGFPKGFPLRFDETYVAKEDIELCGHIMDLGGRIVRVNNICFKAKHRTNKGGCNEVWKSGINEQMAKRLSISYPSIYTVKTNNKQEVRTIIKDTTKNIKPWTKKEAE